MNLGTLGDEWFALQIKAQFEEACANSLRCKGYEQFLPMCRFIPGLRARKSPTRLQPLFPGYLFCKLNADVKGLVVTTPGVIRIVGYGGIPSAIPDEEISAIKSAVQSGRSVSAWPYLRMGQRVSLIDGPLRGVEGILLRYRNVNRLIVSVSLLQRSAAVEIDANWVAPSLTMA